MNFNVLCCGKGLSADKLLVHFVSGALSLIRSYYSQHEVKTCCSVTGKNPKTFFLKNEMFWEETTQVSR